MIGSTLCVDYAAYGNACNVVKVDDRWVWLIDNSKMTTNIRSSGHSGGTMEGDAGGDGAGDRNRTYDLRVTSALLYRLSYTGVESGTDNIIDT